MEALLRGPSNEKLISRAKPVIQALKIDCQVKGFKDFGLSKIMSHNVLSCQFTDNYTSTVDIYNKRCLL